MVCTMHATLQVPPCVCTQFWEHSSCTQRVTRLQLSCSLRAQLFLSPLSMWTVGSQSTNISKLLDSLPLSVRTDTNMIIRRSAIRRILESTWTAITPINLDLTIMVVQIILAVLRTEAPRHFLSLKLELWEILLETGPISKLCSTYTLMVTRWIFHSIMIAV